MCCIESLEEVVETVSVEEEVASVGLVSISGAFSATWTPSSVGSYVGTYIFLILPSALFRGIIAVRCTFLGLWAHWSRI